MSCRVGVWRALERLRIERNIDFERWEILEQEILKFGNTNLFRAKNAVQPGAPGYSKVCGFTHDLRRTKSIALDVTLCHFTPDGMNLADFEHSGD